MAGRLAGANTIAAADFLSFYRFREWLWVFVTWSQAQGPMCLAWGTRFNFAVSFNPLVAESFVTCAVIDRTLNANLNRRVFHPDVMPPTEPALHI